MRKSHSKTLSTLAALFVVGDASAQTFYVDRIQFNSQNGSPTNAWLTDWNADFGTDGGSAPFPNGYLGEDLASTPKASPVAVFGGATIRLSVGMYLDPY